MEILATAWALFQIGFFSTIGAGVVVAGILCAMFAAVACYHGVMKLLGWVGVGE